MTNIIFIREKQLQSQVLKSHKACKFLAGCCAGAGEVSVWEFSGHEEYYSVYDHFVGDPNCIHVVLFRASDPAESRLEQIRFWLDFLRARMAPAEPIGQTASLAEF